MIIFICNAKVEEENQKFLMSCQKSSNRQRNIIRASNDQVILIPDEQSKSNLEDMDNQLLKYQIAKAQLTGSKLYVILAIKKHFLDCPPQNKDRYIKDIILSHFHSKAQIDLQFGYFSERIDEGLSEDFGQVYEKKYLLYGVDLLTTKKIITRFSMQNPQVKWVDASHCILQFEQTEAAMDFIRCQIKNFDDSQIVPWERNPNILARNWVELNTYLEIFVRRIFVRNLTSKDELFIQTRQPPPQKFNAYKQAKIDLQSMLLRDPKVRQVLKKAEEEEQSCKLQDPNYRNSIRKKRIEQKKIQNLMLQSQKGQADQRNYMSRSRDNKFYRRLDARRQQNQFSKRDRFGHLQRYNSNYNNRPTRPVYATVEEINEIRQQISQISGYKHNQTQINNSNYIEQPNQGLSHQAPNDVLNASISSHQQPYSHDLHAQLQQRDQVNNIQNNAMHLSSQNSQFNKLQGQLQKFRLNSSEFSSIFEKSKHQLSNSKFVESQQMSESQYLDSHHLSSQMASNIVSSKAGNSLFEMQKQIEKIPFVNHSQQYQIEQQDGDICDFIYQSKPLASPSEQTLNFNVTAKPLSFNDLNESVQPPKGNEDKAVRKVPKKKKDYLKLQ